jgi:hypothetical protein
MTKLNDIENIIHLLEQKIGINDTEVKSFIETHNIKSIDIEKQIKDINEKVLKLLFISQELVNQGKAHKEIIDEIKKVQDELKIIDIDIEGSHSKMTHAEFAKFILNKINPDKQIEKWSTRIKNSFPIIILIILSIYIIIQSFEMKSLIEILNSLK